MIAMQEKALMARISQRSADAIHIHRDCRYLLQGFSKHSRLCPGRKLGIDAARFVRSRAKSNNAAAMRVKTACQTPSLGGADKDQPAVRELPGDDVAQEDRARVNRLVAGGLVCRRRALADARRDRRGGVGTGRGGTCWAGPVDGQVGGTADRLGTGVM